MINLSCPDAWHPAPCWWCLIGDVQRLFTSANKDRFDNLQKRIQRCLNRANNTSHTWVSGSFFFFFWRTEKLSGVRLCYPFISVSWWKWKGLRVSSDFTSCFISNNSSSCQTDDGFHWRTAYRIFVGNGREQKINHIGSLDFWYCHVDRWGILLFANPACCRFKPCCLTRHIAIHISLDSIQALPSLPSIIEDKVEPSVATRCATPLTEFTSLTLRASHHNKPAHQFHHCQADLSVLAGRRVRRLRPDHRGRGRGGGERPHI